MIKCLTGKYGSLNRFLRNALFFVVLFAVSGALMVVNAQFGGAGGDRLAPSADYDPVYRWESVGDPNTDDCGRTGDPCRYGVDLSFQNPQIVGGKLEFDVSVRAQAEATGTPGDGGTVGVLNFGNVVELVGPYLYYDASIFPASPTEGGFENACTATPVDDDDPNPPFDTPTVVDETDNSQYVITLTSSYGSRGPNRRAQPYFIMPTTGPKVLFSMSCTLPGSGVANSFAGVRFDAFNIHNFQQLYDTSSKNFPQITRFANSLEFFPLDGTSAYIEKAYLADSNHHVGIRFSADMPAGVEPAVTAVRGYYDNLGIHDPDSSSSTTYTATVIRLSNRDIWAVFPVAMKTTLDGTDGDNLLENILITATFAGQTAYISNSYGNAARYRVAVTWGSESSSNSPDSLPPRITDAEFTDTSLGAIALTFSEPVETGIQEVTGESTELTVNDFSVYRWTAGGRVSLPLARVEETVPGDGDKFILHFARSVSLSPGEYVQIFDGEGVESEFYITASSIFSQKRVMRDLPDLSSDYIAAATGAAAGDSDGEYGIGMRENPGYGLIEVPQPNRAPTITPAVANINAVTPAVATSNDADVSEAGFAIADADQSNATSAFPAVANLELSVGTLPGNATAVLNFDQTAYNTAQSAVGNALTVAGDGTGTLTLTGALSLTQFNALFDHLTIEYANLNGAVDVTVTFSDGANGEVGSALMGTARITLSSDAIPPQVTNPAITAANILGTSVQLSWAAAQDQTGAAANRVLCSSNPSSCSSTGVSYEVSIMDPTAPSGSMTQMVMNVPSNSLVLSRANAVLIPGRTYMIQIVAIDSAGNRSDESANAAALRYYNGMVTMGPSVDADGDGIEDSLESIVTDIATHCGGAADADTDNDFLSNANEVRTGTDCRNVAFNDTGLTIGDMAPMVELHRIGDSDSSDSIADYYAIAEPDSDGLTSVPVDDSVASCTGCAELTPLIAMTSSECTGLGVATSIDTTFSPASFASLPGMPDGQDVVFCNISGDSLRLPLGFTSVVWKAVDSAGSVYTGGAVTGSATMLDFTQLYYIAPIATLAPDLQRTELVSDAQQADIELAVVFGKTSAYTSDYGIRTATLTAFLSDAAASGSDGAFTETSTSEETRTELRTNAAILGASNAGQSVDGVTRFRFQYVPQEQPAMLGDGVLFALTGIRSLPNNANPMPADDNHPLGSVPLSINFDIPGSYIYTLGNAGVRVRQLRSFLNPEITITSQTSSVQIDINVDDAFPYHITWEVALVDALTTDSSDMGVVSGAGRSTPADGSDAADPISLGISAEEQMIREIDGLPLFRIRGSVDVDLATDDDPNDWVWERYYLIANTADSDDDGVPDNNEMDDTGEAGVLFAGNTTDSRTMTMNVETKIRAFFGAVSELGRVVLGRYALAQAAATTPVFSALLDENLLVLGITEPPGYAGSGVYDFAVLSSQSAQVIIPLRTAIAEGQGYLKYANRSWSSFAGEDRLNKVLSGKSRSGGTCPEFSELEDRQGNLLDTLGRVIWNITDERGALTAGDDCVFLQIVDGGPNDADSEQNSIIIDPGAIGTAGVSRRDGGLGGGSGSISAYMLLALLLLAAYTLTIRTRRKRPASVNT